ncbi:Serine palmitoyltransferase [Entamoeba marina]
MQSNDDYQLTTWGNLWKYIGIEWQAHVGFYYLTYAGKVADLKDYVLYWFGLCKNKPPLIGESNEDYYIRRLYSTSYDCFNRPICGPPENFITVALRIEVPIESSKHLVVKNDCTKEALNFGSYNYLGFGGRHPVVTKQIVNCFKNKGVCLTGTSYERGVSEEQEQLEKDVS